MDGLEALEVRRVPVSSFPYHVAYLIVDEQIEVLAIAHDLPKTGSIAELPRSNEASPAKVAPAKVAPAVVVAILVVLAGAVVAALALSR